MHWKTLERVYIEIQRVSEEPTLLDRYGSLADLVELSVEHDELRTLSRVLHSAGAKGQMALLQLCERTRRAADDKSAADLLKAELGRLDNGRADDSRVFANLSAEHLYQLVYRSYLSLGMSDAAGMIYSWLLKSFSAVSRKAQ